jgi:chemotaxis protein histidine kinase CheA
MTNLSTNNENQLSLFDYSTLAPDTAKLAKESAIEIKAREKAIWENIIEIGNRLIEVKDALPHGQFEKWCKAEFDWSINYAQKYMRIALEIPKTDDHQFFNGMKMTALYQLASGLANTDEEGKAELMEGIETMAEENDGKLTEKDVKNVVELQKENQQLKESLKEKVKQYMEKIKMEKKQKEEHQNDFKLMLKSKEDNIKQLQSTLEEKEKEEKQNQTKIDEMNKKIDEDRKKIEQEKAELIKEKAELEKTIKVKSDEKAEEIAEKKVKDRQDKIDKMQKELENKLNEKDEEIKKEKQLRIEADKLKKEAEQYAKTLKKQVEELGKTNQWFTAIASFNQRLKKDAQNIANQYNNLKSIPDFECLDEKTKNLLIEQFEANFTEFERNNEQWQNTVNSVYETLERVAQILTPQLSNVIDINAIDV